MVGIHTEYIPGEEAFSRLAAEWDGLVGQSMTNTPFQHLAYQRGWWSHLHPENGSLHTVAVRHADGRLLGIGCFYLIGGVLYFNGCVEETDYLDLITAANEAEAAWTAVFDRLCQPDFPAWQSMDLCNVPQASPTRQILPRLGEANGFSFAEAVHEVCPIIPLPETFEAYLEGIDSKQRREINRKLRRANGAGVTMHIVTPDDDLAQAVDDFLGLLQMSTFEKREWLHEGRRALFHDTARSAQAAGTLQLLFLEVNGRKAAGLFNFDYDGRIWVYNSGLDSSSFSSLSLGVVITAKAIEHAIANGRQVFDFLRGNETYKYRFGAQDTTVYRHHLARHP